MDYRKALKDKKRIVIKIGSSSLTHEETGNLNLEKMERLVRLLTDLRNSGKEVVLVSSGAIAVGRKMFGFTEKPTDISGKQACAAVGQASLMTIYQKLFSEYHQLAAQILMTKYTMIDDTSRQNARNTFEKLNELGAIPIVNENDTVSTDELALGDNDTLSAIVAALIHADLLILLSDIDGLYSDDPRTNPDAEFISVVPELTEEYIHMGKGAGTSFGTGGMKTKLSAARISADSGADMVITNGNNVENIRSVLNGEPVGTLFLAHKIPHFHLINYISGKGE
ncbi:MAG: glutamate 5-kinase [Lachnospiraceae bacterium]|nr:glutamate 5-kinase [Lachnospiraceae bacterium]